MREILQDVNSSRRYLFVVEWKNNYFEREHCQFKCLKTIVENELNNIATVFGVAEKKTKKNKNFFIQIVCVINNRILVNAHEQICMVLLGNQTYVEEFSLLFSCVASNWKIKQYWSEMTVLLPSRLIQKGTQK